ncbi:S9 family peptidase [Psychrobium sp. 1_MG-2023]|uniref:alpha/beta hydrolase family protein n=1 Tax=Psychrobium sp. 1_MG-2023 TaxID=3062624 RepID=UPI00268345A4|nr:alpha/beta fold hydrolase [Psychrobium sp. 1_MG-2023]MDP2561918.1 alpha/beta hydrolase [Psychrobium sp. 1_MG-2023]
MYKSTHSTLVVISVIAILLALFLSGCSQNKMNAMLVSLESRPQMPNQRPYMVKQVQFSGGDQGVVLAGELTYPQDKTTHRAIVLVAGHSAGQAPAPRDMDLGPEANHKTFLVLSHLLTLQGYAVLRYDSRGVGQSSGSWLEATNQVLASDAAAALHWLRTDAGLNLQDSGYLGHSMGTDRALLATQLEPADFLILIAGGLEVMADLLLRQNYEAAQKAGFDQNQLQLLITQYQHVFDLMRRAEDRHQAMEKIESYLTAQGATQQDAQLLAQRICDAVIYADLDTDFSPLMAGYKQPILTILGAKDTWVSLNINEEPIQQQFTNSLSKQRVYPNMNHVLQPAQTGEDDEIWRIKTTVDPKIVDGIDQWLLSVQSTE